jgi:serine-type D-Ala-D-Ala carboxypeptidase/endopeptidase (penicillin-binding protein 4)
LTASGGERKLSAVLTSFRLTAAIAAACAALAVATSAAPGSSRLSAHTASSLSARLTDALAVRGTAAARCGAMALDLRTGAVVFARHPAKPLAPASVEKLSVTYAALVALGPTFRFRTQLLARGSQSGSTLDGDLILRGSGDPTLSTADLRALSAQVKASGIRTVAGRVLGDESLFDTRRTAAGWKPSYYLNESAALSALMVDRGTSGGRLTPRPAAAAAVKLKRALERAGIAVHGRATAARAATPAAAVELATVASPPLWKVLRYMDYQSDNLTAELVLKELGALIGKGGTSAAGAAVVREILAADGIPLAGVRIADGSGLSRLDRTTARTLTSLLEAAWSVPALRHAFLTVLPVAGRTGTLSDRLRRTPTRGKVIAKTGTTLSSSTPAGYVNGRYAFAVLHNGSPVNTWRARFAQDRFVSVLVRAP